MALSKLFKEDRDKNLPATIVLPNIFQRLDIRTLLNLTLTSKDLSRHARLFLYADLDAIHQEAETLFRNIHIQRKDYINLKFEQNLVQCPRLTMFIRNFTSSSPILLQKLWSEVPWQLVILRLSSSWLEAYTPIDVLQCIRSRLSPGKLYSVSISINRQQNWSVTSDDTGTTNALLRNLHMFPELMMLTVNLDWRSAPQYPQYPLPRPNSDFLVERISAGPNLQHLVIAEYTDGIIDVGSHLPSLKTLHIKSEHPIYAKVHRINRTYDTTFANWEDERDKDIWDALERYRKSTILVKMSRNHSLLKILVRHAVR